MGIFFLRYNRLIFITLALFLSASTLKAQEVDTINNLFEMSIEDFIKIPIRAAGKTEQTIAEIPASTVVITRSEIEQYGYRNLREILNNIPGYYALSNLGIDIYGVRGYAKERGGNNFIIMINDTKITDDKILSNYQIPVESIERIEVIRGPMAVMYGNNAFFGVIHIITVKENPDVEHNNLFALSYGSNNTMNSAFRIGTKQNDLRLNIDFGYYNTDGMDKPLASMMKRPEKMDEPLFGGIYEDGLDLPEYARHTKDFLSRTQKVLNINGGFKGFYFNTFLVESKNKNYYYFPSLDEGSSFTDLNAILSAGYKYEFSENLSIDAKVRYAKYNSRYSYRILFEGFYGYDNYYVTEFESEVNMFWRPVERIGITLGMQYENTPQYINEGDVPSGGSQNMYWQFIKEGDHAITGSAYTQISYKLFDRLQFVGGIRAEKSYGYGIDFEFDRGLIPDGDPGKRHDKGNKPASDIIVLPRFAAIYTPHNHHVLKFLYGKAIKRPGIDIYGEDMADIARGDKTDYVEPEFIETFEFNYFSFISNKLNVNLSLYWNRLNNLLVERNAIENDILRAWLTNTGELDTKGVEITIKTKPLDKLILELSGTYQHSYDNTFHTVSSYSPEYMFNAKLAYSLNGIVKFSLIGKYIDAMKPYFDTEPIFDANNNPTGEYIGRTADDVSDYFTLDANIRFEAPFKRNLYLNINVVNLLDQDIFYPTFSKNSLWADKGTWGYGREFYFTLGFKF